MENLSNTQANGEAQSNNAQIIEVSIDKLSVPLSHPRRNPGNLDNLQQSIRKIGMIEPLTVCKAEESDQYMVIDGTRRLTALGGERTELRVDRRRRAAQWTSPDYCWIGLYCSQSVPDKTSEVDG